jgi:molybdopterin synthase catalytic subunit
MNDKKVKKVFVQGAIPPEKIADSISSHQTKTEIGAHSIFLGQVRADVIDGRSVKAIEYSAYEEMAEKEFHKIRENAFTKFELTCAHINHSLGRVVAGEICLFIFTSSLHRKSAIEACQFILESVKIKVPIFGKELFEDETYHWKENQYYEQNQTG